MSRKPSFWIGSFALCGLISIGAVPCTGAQTTSSKKPATSRSTAGRASSKSVAGKTIGKAAPASTSVAPKKSLYSAQRSLSRKAALARARAIATARAINTSAPRYKVDTNGDIVPDVRAAAAIIYNPENGQVLWESNSQDQRSIASITKVMTATVFVESDPDLNEPVTITKGDVFQASTTHLRTNDVVTADDLLHLLLIASDNAAARALARISPLGPDGFVWRMNQKAVEFGLEATHYADPSGLLSDNVSSAYDMARLIAHASGDERISAIMRTQEYTVHAAKRDITFHSTDHLLGREEFDIRAAKTGFISKAGYCLATLLRLPQTGQDVAVVVLGARSNAGRFAETQNLFRWLSTHAPTVFATKAPAVQQ